MKLQTKNMKYGCFTAVLSCAKCNKHLIQANLSYYDDKIGIGDTAKIFSFMVQKVNKMGMNYCYSCGAPLVKELEELEE